MLDDRLPWIMFDAVQVGWGKRELGGGRRGGGDRGGFKVGWKREECSRGASGRGRMVYGTG